MNCGIFNGSESKGLASQDRPRKACTWVWAAGWGWECSSDLLLYLEDIPCCDSIFGEVVSTSIVAMLPTFESISIWVTDFQDRPLHYRQNNLYLQCEMSMDQNLNGVA